LGRDDLVANFINIAPLGANPDSCQPVGKIFSAIELGLYGDEADFIDIAVLGANPYPRQPLGKVPSLSKSGGMTIFPVLSI
jgi:hypothetical protein